MKKIVLVRINFHFYLLSLFIIFSFASFSTYSQSTQVASKVEDPEQVSFTAQKFVEDKLLKRAQQAIALKNYQVAVQLYEQVEKSSSSWHSWAATSALVAFYRRIDEPDMARGITQRVIQKRPELKGLMLLWDGDTALLVGDSDRALLEYDQAEKEFGQQIVDDISIGVSALRQISNIYVAKKDFLSAAKVQKKLLASYPQRINQQQILARIVIYENSLLASHADLVEKGLVGRGGSSANETGSSCGPTADDEEDSRIVACAPSSSASDGFQDPFASSSYGDLFMTHPAAAGYADYPDTSTGGSSYYHPGVDLNGAGDDCGEPFYAVAQGCVSFAETTPSDWGSITIKHYYVPANTSDFYWVSQYGHSNHIYYSSGAAVSKGSAGDTLGTIDGIGDGGTREWPCHLHFEIREPDHPRINDACYWNPSQFSSQSSVGDWYENPESFIEAHQAFDFVMWFDEGSPEWNYTGTWNLITTVGNSSSNLTDDLKYTTTATTQTADAKFSFTATHSGTHTIWMFVPWNYATSESVPVKVVRSTDDYELIDATINQYGSGDYCDKWIDDDSDRIVDSDEFSSGANCDKWIQVGSATLIAGFDYYLEISNNTGESGRYIAIDDFMIIYNIGAGLGREDASDDDGASDSDIDDDGLTDVEEETWGTYNGDQDSDNDWLLDGEEVHTYGTSPTDDDSDDDGLEDGLEVGIGTDPLDTDTDGDGWSDGYEIEHGTDPRESDADSDTTDDDGDGYNELTGDCNDSDATIFPGATELCGDGIDQDCDGADLSCAGDDEPTDSNALVASDGATKDYFGYDVAVSADVAVVGAYKDDGVGTDSGSAYVFRFNGSSWTQEGKLIASDAARYYEFGNAVAVDRDVIVVGAHQALSDSSGYPRGAAYVFRYNSSTSGWDEEAILTASDGEIRDVFGKAVAVSGDVAVIGAYTDDDAGYEAGSVYVFRWDGSGWNQETKLTACDAAAGDHFGSSVSIDGDKIVVGTWDQGVYFFYWDGSVWQPYYVPETGHCALLTTDSFGKSVSLSQDAAVIGNVSDDTATVYRWNGSTWYWNGDLTASDGVSGDNFGIDVAISGDRVVVGAYQDDDLAESSGSAYVYTFDGSDWNEEEKILPGTGAYLDFFGRSVAVSGDRVIVGKYLGDELATDAGSAYIFSLVGPTLNDTDSDGLTDAEEETLGTDLYAPDSDDDDVSDGDEVDLYGTNPLDSDTDDDGYSDGYEINSLMTDPNKVDTDDDGLSDYDELNVYGTDPSTIDSIVFDDRTGVFDVDVYGAYDNVALGKDVVSHVAEDATYSTGLGYFASNLTDGSLGTLAYPANIVFDYEIDLGSPEYLESVLLYWGEFGETNLATYITSWTLTGTLSDGTEIILGSGDAPEATQTLVMLDPELQTLEFQALEISATSTTNWIGIYELMAYSPDPDTDDDGVLNDEDVCPSTSLRDASDTLGTDGCALSQLDSDSDGLSDYDEAFTYETDPAVSNSSEYVWMEPMEYPSSVSIQSYYGPFTDAALPTSTSSDCGQGSYCGSFSWVFDSGYAVWATNGFLSGTVDASAIVGVTSGVPVQGELGFWFRLNELSALNALNIYFGSSAFDRFFVTVTLPTDTSWHYFSIPLTTATIQGTPDWTRLAYGAFESWSNASGSFSLDGIMFHKFDLDDDGDGFAASVDCDDADASINPGASEVCDDVDNNCDGVIDTDAVDAETWYRDSDRDKFGDVSVTLQSCDRELGYVSNSLDCDDTNKRVNPLTKDCRRYVIRKPDGSVSIKPGDGLDNDCDGSTDEDPPCLIAPPH